MNLNNFNQFWSSIHTNDEIIKKNQDIYQVKNECKFPELSKMIKIKLEPMLTRLSKDKLRLIQNKAISRQINPQSPKRAKFYKSLKNADYDKSEIYSKIYSKMKIEIKNSTIMKQLKDTNTFKCIKTINVNNVSENSVCKIKINYGNKQI